MSWLDHVKFGDVTGRVDVVVQDASTGTVLRVGHVDRQALRSMHESGLVTLRTPERRYVCGEVDGDLMRVMEVWLNEARDALVVRVCPARPGASLSSAFELVESRDW